MIIVRFAVSAVAAVSGLFLLGLAVYGQPAVYLRQVREGWNALLDRPAEDPSSVPVVDPNAERAARLQQEVARLQAELAVRQQTAATTQEPGAAVPPAAPLPAPKPPDTVMAAPATPAPAVSAPAVSAPAVSAPAAAAAPAPAPAPTPPQAPAPVPDEAKATAAAETPPAKVQASKPQRPPTQSVEVPERHVAAVEQPPVRMEPAKAPPPTPGKLAVAPQRPVPAPPALPQPALVPPAPRQEADDTQSVLARLRQGTAPPSVDSPPLQDTPPSAPSPSLPRLVAARAALASGRVEGARRLLQEVQLQLVFRPVSPDGDPAPAAGRGAADVAHALDALSANDIGMAQRYVAVALDDLTGKQTSPPIQQTDRRGSGYAPAYPPR